MDDKTEDRRLEKDSTKTPDTKKSKEKLISKNHRLVKRTTVQYPKRKKDIYVNNTTSFKAYLKICEKILDSDAKEVVIHGLGKAISRACNLALRVQEIHYGTLELDIKTSAVNLTDDLEPKTEDFNCEVNDRINPAVHIRVFRSALIGSLRFSGLTIFEIWINLVSLTIFTILLALKLDDGYFSSTAGWWIVFSPLFVADGLNTYFCAIIFIRMHMEGMIKLGIMRALRSLISLLLVFVFKYLLCKKLSGQSTLQYSEVLTPVFILLQLIAIRACQLH